MAKAFRIGPRQVLLGVVGAAIVIASMLWAGHWYQKADGQWQSFGIRSSELRGGLLGREVSFFRGLNRLTLQCVSGTKQACRLHVVDVRASGLKALHAALARKTAGVAVNGGYFDALGSPVGAMRSAAVDVTPASGQTLLSGVVIGGDVTPPALADVGSNTWKTEPDARQAGPFLVGPRETTGNRTAVAERTVVVMSDDRVGLLTCSAISLDDLADLLPEYCEAIGMPGLKQALNLDGGPSSGMVLWDRGQCVGAEPRGRIADALVLRPVVDPLPVP